MWICRKCHQRVTVAGNICRACGGILEELAEAQLSAETGQHIDADRGAGSSPESSGTGSAEHGAKPPVVLKMDAENSDQAFAGTDWTCQHCSAVVPGTFDVCWNCLATRTGERNANAAQLLSEVDANDQEPEPENSWLASEALAEPDREEVPPANCPRCGSTQLIRNATILDQGDGPRGKLNVVIFGSPGALLLKNPLSGEILADICGTCGHVALRVANPGTLYQHYLSSLDRERSSAANAPFACPCRKCGMLVVKGSVTCPHCSASQTDSQW